MNRFEQFSLLIFEISKQWHKITTEEMKSFGLRGPHSLYLLTLLNAPEGISAPRLCEVCDKNKADVSRTMATLQEKELVVKVGDNQKQYGGLYVLTKQGVSLAQQIRDRTNLAVELAGRDLDDPSREILYNALKSIADNLKEVSATSLTEVAQKGKKKNEN